MEKLFSIGDVVVLKSGGPNMTIIDDKLGIGLDVPGGKVFNGNYMCSWFEGSKENSRGYHQDALLVAPKPTGPILR